MVLYITLITAPTVWPVSPCQSPRECGECQVASYWLAGNRPRLNPCLRTRCEVSVDAPSAVGCDCFHGFLVTPTPSLHLTVPRVFLGRRKSGLQRGTFRDLHKVVFNRPRADFMRSKVHLGSPVSHLFNLGSPVCLPTCHLYWGHLCWAEVKDSSPPAARQTRQTRPVRLINHDGGLEVFIRG